MELLSVVPIQFLHGLVYGMLLFLVASGLTLIFGMMGVPSRFRRNGDPS